MTGPTRYADIDPISTGLRGKCPRCGEGQLLGLLSVKERCTACGLSFDFEDAGDGAAIFVILGLGALLLGLLLYVELSFEPPLWVHVVVWPPLVLALGLPAMRGLKGLLIALQYKHDASSGRLDQ